MEELDEVGLIAENSNKTGFPRKMFIVVSTSGSNNVFFYIKKQIIDLSRLRKICLDRSAAISGLPLLLRSEGAHV